MRPLATIITTAIVCGSAAAATPDYDAVIRDALATGYGLRPDSLAGAASVAAMHADNTLAGPEAEMEYLWPSDGTDNRWSLSLSQSFDWPGAYRARRAEAQTAREAARAVYEVATLDKAFEVKMLVLDIINARQRIGLLRSTLTNVDLMDSLIRVAYDREAATALDIRKSALARLDISSNIAVAEADLALKVLKHLEQGKAYKYPHPGGMYIRRRRCTRSPSAPRSTPSTARMWHAGRPPAPPSVRPVPPHCPALPSDIPMPTRTRHTSTASR